MRKSIQLLVAATTIAGLGVTTMPAASADSTIITVKKRGNLSDSHKIAYVKVKVTCSEDTASAQLTATLAQVTVGGAQTQTAQVTSINAFECDGTEETKWLSMRRPSGGFNWEKGKARVIDFTFTTQDVAGTTYSDTHRGRTITLR